MLLCGRPCITSDCPTVTVVRFEDLVAVLSLYCKYLFSPLQSVSNLRADGLALCKIFCSPTTFHLIMRNDFYFVFSVFFNKSSFAWFYILYIPLFSAYLFTRCKKLVQNYSTSQAYCEVGIEDQVSSCSIVRYTL